MASANRRSKTRAKNGAANTFKNTCRIGSICLAANLIIRILFARSLILRENLKGFSLWWKGANRRPHRRAGAGRKQKRGAVQRSEF